MPYERTVINPGSDAEFTFSRMQQQLGSLPGDQTDPTNAVWQHAVLGSVEHKINFLVTADNYYKIRIEAELQAQSIRLKKLGAVVSATALDVLSKQLHPDEAA